MAKFGVDPDKLAAAVTEMEACHRTAQESVHQAEVTMNQLKESWGGEAAVAAQDAHRKVQDGAEQMRQALVALKDFLNAARTGYAAAIKGNSEMWGVG